MDGDSDSPRGKRRKEVLVGSALALASRTVYFRVCVCVFFYFIIILLFVLVCERFTSLLKLIEQM